MQLTQQIALEFLMYNEETGELFWKHRDAKWFENEGSFKKWNTRYANKLALAYKSEHGYLTGRIFRKLYQAHRIIWFMKTGEWPDQIDHINGIRDDNRWKNLRNVSNAVNSMNHQKPKHNKSGHMNVWWDKSIATYRVEIKVNGKKKHIGCSKDLDVAAEMAKNARQQFGYHKNHGRSEPILE